MGKAGRHLSPISRLNKSENQKKLQIKITLWEDKSSQEYLSFCQSKKVEQNLLEFTRKRLGYSHCLLLSLESCLLQPPELKLHGSYLIHMNSPREECWDYHCHCFSGDLPSPGIETAALVVSPVLELGSLYCCSQVISLMTDLVQRSTVERFGNWEEVERDLDITCEIHKHIQGKMTQGYRVSYSV